MLTTKEYGTKKYRPLSLPKEKLEKETYLREKGDLLSYNRYPEFGPLNINCFTKFLEFAKEFFVTYFEKSYRFKVKMNDFQISHELGKGAFGHVVLAKHLPSNIEYGIKIISKKRLVKLKLVKQTLQEKKILQGLNCPFTIYLMYFFMDNSYLFFVLPYIMGRELFDYLGKFGKFEEYQARFYISQVILGLEYLHHLDLIYRDLKPENILVDHTGYIKLVDFGFSKILKNSRTYTLCGTPEYMAPEIILNVGHGPPADWWASGVLLYELVSGQTPFQHANKMCIYEKILMNSYHMSDSFSEGLTDLIHNLLQTDTTKRYGNLKRRANDIKDHRWFKTTNWLAILNRKISPPFDPMPKIEARSGSKPIMYVDVETEDKFADIFREFDSKS